MKRVFRSAAAAALLALACGPSAGAPTGPPPPDRGAQQGAAGRMAELQVAGRAVAVPAQDPDDGLATTGSTTYAVDVAGGAVHVAVDLTATNTVPSTSRGFTYFVAVGVVTLAEATNVVATTADGTPLGAEVEPIDGTDLVAFVRIDLPGRLLFQETERIHLTYDLPDQGPRAARVTRVNPAFAAVIPLPFGDPGAADVTVLVPDSLDVELPADTPLTRADAGDHQSFSATAITDPLSFDGTLIARDVDGLQRTAAEGEHDIEVAAWPGDTEWATFVAGLVRDGLPVMEELIGLPWPVEGRLDIVETVAPYLYGYAGWFDPAEDRIEVGDELDPAVVLHELSHAWFQFEHFDERWINEGLAEEFSGRVLDRLGLPAPAPEPIDATAPGAVWLSDWTTPSLTADISDEQEAFGYNASFAVVRALSEEIGVEGLARVVEAATNDRIAYQGDPDPERWPSGTDWRRFLDLLEEVGGATIATELFRAHVVPEPAAHALARRSELRTSYDALESAGAGWTPPLAVREEMAAWDFDAAVTAIADAHAVLATREAIADAAERLGLEVPAGLEEDYEEAEDLDELDEVAAEAEALLAGVEDLANARAAVDGGRNLLERIGTIGNDPQDELDDAIAAFERADPHALEEASAATIAAVEAADRDGAVRLAAAAGVLLLVVGARRGWRAVGAGSQRRATASALDRLRGGTPDDHDPSAVGASEDGLDER